MDLHWNKDHTAVVGTGKVDGENFSFRQEVGTYSYGKVLVFTFKIGQNSWVVNFKKGLLYSRCQMTSFKLLCSVYERLRFCHRNFG